MSAKPAKPAEVDEDARTGIYLAAREIEEALEKIDADESWLSDLAAGNLLIVRASELEELKGCIETLSARLEKNDLPGGEEREVDSMPMDARADAVVKAMEKMLNERLDVLYSGMAAQMKGGAR